MKHYIWMMMLMGVVGICVAEEPAMTTTKDDMATEMNGAGDPWRVSAGLVYKNWLYEHDAIQQRDATIVNGSQNWEQGTTSGNGAGLQAKIGRGEGRLNVTFLKSDYSFDWKPVGGDLKIDTVSRELELSWTQERGHSDLADWGSTIGFRYIGMQKQGHITEEGKSVDGYGDMTWMLLMGGYDGNVKPFETPTFQAHGSLYFFLGEASGTARSGSDTNWTDGIISETYSQQYSLAYGARASFGVDLAITKQVMLTIDYMREWLYSFDSTDTGIAVFPDNYDALFIENHHAVVASLNYIF